jgi:integral membrane protein (TIGR01906 family)
MFIQRIGAIVGQMLLVSILPLLFISSSIASVVNCQPFYENSFERYEIAQKTGFNNNELEQVAEELINYFNSDKEFISLVLIKDGCDYEFFTEREILHLKDVRDLFRLNYLILSLSLVLTFSFITLAVFRSSLRLPLAKIALCGGGLTILLIIAISIVSIINFNDFFWQFHIISFSNDFWILDPEIHHLVQLFPQGFWFDATIFVAITASISAVIVGLLAWIYLHRTWKAPIQTA